MTSAEKFKLTRAELNRLAHDPERRALARRNR
jgi:hypothetical protein